MPPPGARRPRRRARRRWRSARDALDAAAAATPESRMASVPAAQPRRVPRARSRTCSTLDVDVSAFLPADTISDGFDNVADVADVLADADGRLPARRRPGHDAGDRRSRRAAERNQLQRAEDRVAAAPRRRRAVRHARRHLGRAHVPGRRRLRLPHGPARQRVRRAVRRHRPPASRSRSRSTASAWRSSTSIRA